MMFKTIYVDMDGVLADFEKHADTLMGGTLSSQPKKNDVVYNQKPH